MLKFLEEFTNVDHYYCFADENGKLYYWKTNNSDVYNTCYDYGQLIGINVLEFNIKDNGKRLNRNGQCFEEIKVSRWERCA